MSEQTIPNEAETIAIAPVPPPLEQQPVDPGTQSWNPPTGDEDFDALFQRVGVDGENLTNSNTIPTEPTTAAEEPAPQVVQTTPEPQWRELKTKTGTVYKTYEDTVKGIETKDTTIEQLRSMIAAVTGEDPLSKSGIKPGTTNAQPKPVSYLQDDVRFAQDLTQAAEVGQKTNDWKAYRNTLGQFVYEVVQSAVGPYMPVVQNVGKQQALENVSKDVPDFRNFYGSTDYQKVLEQSPNWPVILRPWKAIQPCKRIWPSNTAMFGMSTKFTDWPNWLQNRQYPKIPHPEHPCKAVALRTSNKSPTMACVVLSRRPSPLWQPKRVVGS